MGIRRSRRLVPEFEGHDGAGVAVADQGVLGGPGGCHGGEIAQRKAEWREGEKKRPRLFTRSTFRERTAPGLPAHGKQRHAQPTMAATSPDAAGPSGREEVGGGNGSADAAPGAGGGPPPPPSRPTPPPLGLDTAPLLSALGLLDDQDDEEGLDTGEVVLREGGRERGGCMPRRERT